MKIFSTASMIAVLVGFGAIANPSTVLATNCNTAIRIPYAEKCNQGDESACVIAEQCMKYCLSNVSVSGTPPIKHNHALDMVISNSKRNDDLPVAK